MNVLTELPGKIKQLTKLKTLILSANKLESLPNEITRLNELDTFDISFNTGLNISKEMERLKQIKGLQLLKIAGTVTDEKSIKEIRKALPETKIIATLEDLLNDSQ